MNASVTSVFYYHDDGSGVWVRVDVTFGDERFSLTPASAVSFTSRMSTLAPVRSASITATEILRNRQVGPECFVAMIGVLHLGGQWFTQ